jgi:hypothetical protein
MLLLMLSLVPCTLCQNITGSGVSDGDAHRLYYISLSSLSLSLLRDNLTNNVGLTADDVTAAMTALGNFKLLDDSAISQYNATVSASASNYTALTALQTQQAVITSDTQTFLRKTLSAVGYAALESTITAEKVNMSISPGTAAHSMASMASPMSGPPGCTGMNPQYSTTKTQTMSILSWSPFHATATFTWTLSGTTQTSGDCGSVTHTGTVNVAVGGHYFSQQLSGNPTTYFLIPASVTLDTNETNSCLVTHPGCEDDSNDGVYCSFIGHNIFQEGGTLYEEAAFTLTQYTGVKGLCQNGQCPYYVRNWCTAATTPPDNDFTGRTIGDAVQFDYWRTVALCTSPNDRQPWFCFKAAALGTNESQPLYACTYNP